MVDDLDWLDRDPVHKQIVKTGQKLKRKYRGDYEENMKLAILMRIHLIHKATRLDGDWEEDDFSGSDVENKWPVTWLYEFSRHSVYAYVKCD